MTTPNKAVMPVDLLPGSPTAVTITPLPGGGCRLQAVMHIPQKIEKVFAFFSDPLNLEKITPPWLHFSVQDPEKVTIHKGATIDYRLKVRGLPLRWRSLISQWQPPYRFVDEQIRGPYKLWRHQHLFEPTAGGTTVSDIVHYRVFGGRIIERALVRPDLKRIFQFRQTALGELFAPQRPPASSYTMHPI